MPLDWLLEPESPSVRCRALTGLLGLPADHPDVQAARRRIPAQPLVQRLFALQNPDGSWGPDPAKPYTAEGALGVLSLLHMHAVEPDERTAAGCDSFLAHAQHESGGFSMTATRRSGIFPCTTGQHLPFLVHFGFGDDPRVRGAFAFLVDSHSPRSDAPDPLTCGRYDHRPCLWGAIAALNGLAVLPAALRSAQSAALVHRLSDALLDAPYDFAGEHKRWLTLSVPRGWDLLAALTALAAHGFAADPRFARLRERLLALRTPDGRWLCGSASRTWPLEPRNRPSKWLTLDALTVCP